MRWHPSFETENYFIAMYSGYCNVLNNFCNKDTYLDHYSLQMSSSRIAVDISHDLGIIFHWGVYAVPGFDSIKSARRRQTQNGSEWYLKRLLDADKEYRPTSGSKETAAYHAENFAGMDYRDFAKSFTADKWDPDSWMRQCKDAGARYVILTARHHDGFCLWPSAVAPKWNSAEVGPRRDLILEFKRAAERHNLIFGVYYSWLEFDISATKDYINRISRPQILELIKYDPKIWFFDGHWAFKTKHSREFMREMCDLIHKEIPGSLINDRTGDLATPDYYVFGDRYIPETRPSVPWVHINTIGLSWGYNAQQTKDDYKSGDELEEIKNKVRGLGGGILLNFGPKADGTLDGNEVASLLNRN